MRRLDHRARGPCEPRRGLEISRCQTATLVPAARFCPRVLHLGFVPTEGWAERRQAPSCYRCRAGKRECGPRGDARIASCEAAPDALAFRRSTVAVPRHAPLRLRIISGNALNERDANLLLRTRFVVNRKVRIVVKKVRPSWPGLQGSSLCRSRASGNP
jgi:hypothetical protein